MNGIKNAIHRFGYLLLMALRGIFFVTGKIPFLIILVIIGWYGFVVNDQGRDMMISFVVDDINQGVGPYLFLFIAHLVLWATLLWYVARITLYSANLKKILDRRVNPRIYTIQGSPLPEELIAARLDLPYKICIENLSRWVPRFLALFPYLIFLGGFMAVSDRSKGNIAVMVWVSILAIVHFIYLWKRKWLVTGMLERIRKRKAPHLMADRFNLEPERKLWKIVRKQRLKGITYIVVAGTLAAFFYAFYTTRYAVPGLHGKPGLIIITALIVYSLIGLFITYWSNLLKFPFLVVLMVLALAFSLPRNNNHNLVTVPGTAQPGRESDTAFVRHWLESRLESASGNITVFIIAAEGGGIRACYWTANVLRQLHHDFDSIFPGNPSLLYRNTFAVTGASGGSVGLGFYYNYVAEQQRAAFDRNDDYLSLDTIAGSDYLSAVSFGFAFPDLLQRLLPFKVNSWDRGKFLGNSFSKAFREYTRDTGSVTWLDRSYLDMWPAARRYERPALLFNSLYVEQGQKAVFSPFVLSPRFYPDVLDIIDTIGVSPAMKEGMLSSARFPAITPPGLMERFHYSDNGQISRKPFGHLVDGGYFENTAVQTAQQTALLIQQVAASMPQLRQRGLTVRPIILSIVYGGPVHGAAKPLGASYELAPLTGAIHTLFRWFDGVRATNISLDTSGSLQPVYFRLYNQKMMDSLRQDSSIFKPPLGWCLSATSRQVIRNQTHDTVYVRALGRLLRRMEEE